jgi:hypothetical protein
MGWPEMGNEGEVELAAATVGGEEGIDSIRARAALGLGLAFCSGGGGCGIWAGLSVCLDPKFTLESTQNKIGNTSNIRGGIYVLLGNSSPGLEQKISAHVKFHGGNYSAR